MLSLKINGEDHAVDVPPDMPLLWVLRDVVGLTGTKFGCGIAQCGVCTVHLDGILVVTPEYNYSIPGVLKNAIDWASRPYGDSAWNGKPAAIMGASIGTIATARAQYHLRQIFVFLNMFPINQPEVMIGNASERFDAQGNLTDDATKEHIRKALQSLVDWTRRLQPR